MKLTSDVDIDLADRDAILQHIVHVPASMRMIETPRKHNTGVYVTDVPLDSLGGMAGIDYVEAEQRGYFKLDLLNIHVYNSVRDEAHLLSLMREPDWSKLKDQKFFSNLIHIGNHYRSMRSMPQPIDSIPRLAMFQALIRPAKKHLIGKPWAEVAQTIWDKSPDGYAFKKSHAVAYAHLVVVHMNLLSELGHSTN